MISVNAEKSFDTTQKSFTIETVSKVEGNFLHLRKGINKKPDVKVTLTGTN